MGNHKHCAFQHGAASINCAHFWRKENTMKFVERTFYGVRAQKIFDDYCEEMGFNKAASKDFGQHCTLYSPKATKEGYGVWFLANSNWTRTKGGIWKNTIAGNLRWIEEKCDKQLRDESESLPSDKRIVFAKHPHYANGYIFLGVYELVSYNEKTCVTRFERVASEYAA